MIAGKPKLVRNYLGLALIPQAGVAIGLAALGARTLGGEAGNALETIILASSVLYELIGPACAKLSLYFSKSYSSNIDEIVPPRLCRKCRKTPRNFLLSKFRLYKKSCPLTQIA